MRRYAFRTVGAPLKPKKSFLAVALVICLLAARGKKPANDSNSPNPPDNSPSSSAQVSPPPAAAPTAAPTTAPTPAPPPALTKPAAIRAGSVLAERTQPELSFTTNRQGNPLDATHGQPIVADRKFVASAGPSSRGTVTESHKAGYSKAVPSSIRIAG